MTSRTHSILVVDDDSMVLSLYVDALAEAGHRVEVANNGDAALRRLQTGPVPCVVLTDVRMPVMDGFELSSALAADPQLASIPVVMMTGDRILSFTSPARDKPFDPAELDALVQRSCVLHRRQEGAA
ncbi:MAG TPA: response regulator [Candidatus Limnocylindria bacterium]|jgi:CheY-like chemotaxis protein|nr:response regulator [Candidatus Limnocylindria bacterium]